MKATTILDAYRSSELEVALFCTDNPYSDRCARRLRQSKVFYQRLMRILDEYEALKALDEKRIRPGQSVRIGNWED